MPVIAASTGWYVGLALGVVVVLVAAAIVITIVLLANRIAGQARTAVQGVETVREQTDRARRGRPDQRLGRADPALGAGAAKGGGGQMTVTYAALSNHGAWWIALAIGLVVGADRGGPAAGPGQDAWPTSAGPRAACSDVAGKVACNTANIPQLEATAPVLGLIVEEAVVQDGYMNALTDGFGGA